MNNFLEVENFVKKKMMELVRYKDKEQNNLLSFTVQCGYYDIAELLIKNGLPINTKNVINTLKINIYRKKETHLCTMLLHISMLT
jgi:hypothetical protein